MFSESFWKGIIINFIAVLLCTTGALFAVLQYNDIIITIEWINIAIITGLILFIILFIAEIFFYYTDK